MNGRQPTRRTTMPFENTTRRKPRRWPLALRFVKGSIHVNILIQVVLHTAFAALVVFCDRNLHQDLGLPQSIIPSLSIVVGLMLVFRNQTSYNRFWDGRAHLGVIITSVRNLNRHFLACSYNPANAASSPPAPARLAERADTERAVKLLVAVLFATKNHLRGDWGGFHGISSRAASRAASPLLSRRGSSASISSSSSSSRAKAKSKIRLPDPGAFLRNRQQDHRHRHHQHSHYNHHHDVSRSSYTRTHASEYADLVPPGLVGYESRGLGMALQLATLVEGYIKRGITRSWWPAPQASQLSAQLGALVDAYGKMETIRLTPVPVALLIHQKQVLALFGAVLPFAMVREQGWWAVPITALVVFTLYGIDGIATQLEDPFGFDRMDINMDAIVEDIRTEQLVLLDEWRRVGESEGKRMDGGREEEEEEEEEGRTREEGDGSRSMEASGALASSGVLGTSTLVDDGSGGSQKRRGEEGGDWFISPQGGRVLSWGTVRFEDEI